uniref:Bulb-type lectin domain-containing protein n=1 Tax=candidate division WOR-3 bacterium TaxID=2052148 RepID=A0A7C6EGX2_UNCW3
MKYCFLILVTNLIVYTAPPDTLWTKTYGYYNDFGLAVEQTTDGGYIVTGYSDPKYHADSLDIFLLKVDSTGAQKWLKTYNLPGWECGYQVKETPDHNYIVVGAIRSAHTGGSDVYLFKADTNGNLLWSKTYGGPKDDAGTSIDLTSDNGYIIGGHTYSFGAGADYYLIKTDSFGETLWTKHYGGERDDIGNVIKRTYDNGYIIVGSSNSFNTSPDSFVIYLVKTNADGETLWTRTYPYNESRWYHGIRIQQTPDRGYIIVGSEWYGDEKRHDILLIKTDEKGGLLWRKTFGDTSNEVAKGIELTADGGYIITGYTTPYVMFGGIAWLLKTNSKGDSIWRMTFPGNGQSWSFSVKQTLDYGYILTGRTHPNQDIFLVKTAPDLPVKEKPHRQGSCLLPFFR